MILEAHPVRLAITAVGLLVFVLLAAGSEHEDEYVPPPTPPEEIGMRNAIEWARTNSAALASRIQEVEAAQSEARREIRRLESLKGQFPEQASKISASLSAWRQAAIRLESALSAVNRKISEAYVASQVGESSGPQLLEKVADDWQPSAQAALQEVKRLQELTGAQ